MTYSQHIASACVPQAANDNYQEFPQLCCVYVAFPTAWAHPVKVGVSSDPRKRIVGLQTACPYPLKYIALMFPSRQMALAVERKFHELFIEYRTYGEWFQMERLELLRKLCLVARDEVQKEPDKDRIICLSGIPDIEEYFG